MNIIDGIINEVDDGEMSEGELERKISYVLVDEDLQNIQDLELLENDMNEK